MMAGWLVVVTVLAFSYTTFIIGTSLNAGSRSDELWEAYQKGRADAEKRLQNKEE